MLNHDMTHLPRLAAAGIPWQDAASSLEQFPPLLQRLSPHQSTSYVESFPSPYYKQRNQEFTRSTHTRTCKPTVNKYSKLIQIYKLQKTKLVELANIKREE